MACFGELAQASDHTNNRQIEPLRTKPIGIAIARVTAPSRNTVRSGRAEGLGGIIDDKRTGSTANFRDRSDPLRQTEQVAHHQRRGSLEGQTLERLQIDPAVFGDVDDANAQPAGYRGRGD